MSVANSYKLSEKEHNQVLKQIERTYLKGITGKEFPSIVILGGQPGCGKTGLIKHYCETLFTDDDVCIINGDDLRGFHPKSDEIFKLYDKQYANITDIDVRVWTRELLDLAVSKKVNIIFEGTMRTTQICETIKKLFNEEYNIIISPMAVPLIISTYSICNRYMIAKKETGKARFVSFASHDEAYSNMITTLKQIVQDKKYHKIFTYGRTLDGLDEIIVDNDEILTEKIQRYRLKKLSVFDQKVFRRYVRNLVGELRRLGEAEVLAGFIKAYRKWIESLSSR